MGNNKVYTIGRRLGTKPKEYAFSEIEDKLKDGDTVVLNSDIIDAVSIHAQITIDGNGYTFYVPEGKSGINLYNHCKIENCNMVLGENRSGIASRVSGVELHLENFTVAHESSKNFSLSISVWKFPLSKLICNNVVIDQAQLRTKELSGDSLTLGSAELDKSEITFMENEKWSAVKIDLGTLNAVNTTTLGVSGRIQELNALEVGVTTYDKNDKILIDKFTMDMGLDPDGFLTNELIDGLKIYGNTIIKQVISPEVNIDRYKKSARLFLINPNKDIVVNISGEWAFINRWGNRVNRGNINFRNYEDKTPWFFYDESSQVMLVDAKIKRKNKFTPKPIPKPVPKPKSAQNKLDEMIGLTDVKKKVKTYIATSIVNEMRKKKGEPVNESSLHLIFSGAPGTGKTQVARLLARILFENEIISKPDIKEVTAKDMIGEYTGQTSPKTHNLIMKAKGGILFIDEAYELDPEGGNAGTYKREAITTLVKDMDDYRSDLIVIMAGYTKNMEKLLQSNPGLPSRFVNKISFPDYSAEDLLAITYVQLGQQKQKLDDDAKVELENYILKAKQNNQVDGNGRWVRNIIQFISQARDVRIVSDGTLKTDPEAFNKIKLTDVREGIENI
ncbi:AAA family ATPase [Dellaglioa algida]|uniref:ATPase of the AAA+ class n=1 Tax=Dellaglioa algida DSM 15638 TaxID=1423719 RepID=A0A0R1HG22_9LACO|nr:AAA family ATPase [Dellaglioa algida]KRK45292.1 ATPase of the AAA+ class [Dellaglioa algida DSM 15638]MDK1733427.1 AAA family ATPase [Dellaglioa algida]MDK1734948.1 AAA family ATPase [Dellaglioa algida]